MGPYFVGFCGYSCHPLGLSNKDTIDVLNKYPQVFFPATSDFVRREERPYFEVAEDFSAKFSVRMFELVKAGKK